MKRRPFIFVTLYVLGLFFYQAPILTAAMKTQLTTSIINDMEAGKGEDEKNPATVKLNRLDLLYTYRSGSIASNISLNLRDPYSPAVNSNSGNITFEDAWIQYRYSPALGLKIGYEDAYWIYDGRNTEIWSGVRLDRAENYGKVEISGSPIRNFTYEIMFWATETSESITSQKAAKISYRIGAAKLGAIYRSESESETERTGNAIFASYASGSFAVHAKIAQEIKDAEAEGGSITVLGGTYRINYEFWLSAAYTQHTPVNQVDNPITHMDFSFWKRFSNQLNGFIQYYTSEQTDVEGKTTLLALGMKLKQ